MRAALWFATAQVLVVAVALFFASGNTDDVFAWTIEPTLTAAFLGAAYWGAFGLLGLAALERDWANARISVPSILTFTPLMFLATLIHVDKFHLDTGGAVARAAGWGWVVLYALVVVVMPAGVLLQLRDRSADPPGASPLPRWFRILIAVEAAGLLVLGIALWIAQGDASDVWPWALTDLTARAVGSWCLGVGVGAFAIAIDGDRRRTRIALITFAALGLLELVALARYPDTPDWDAGAWLYVAALIVIAATGIYGALPRRPSLSRVV